MAKKKEAESKISDADVQRLKMYAQLQHYTTTGECKLLCQHNKNLPSRLKGVREYTFYPSLPVERWLADGRFVSGLIVLFQNSGRIRFVPKLKKGWYA